MVLPAWEVSRPFATVTEEASLPARDRFPIFTGVGAPSSGGVHLLSGRLTFAEGLIESVADVARGKTVYREIPV